jgi:hypothetical protein
MESNIIFVPQEEVKSSKKKEKKANSVDEDVLRVMIYSLKASSSCLVVHPSWNYHSYQPVSFFSRISFFSGRRRCFTCQQPFRITTDAAVQCLGCGVYAHRSCAFRGPMDEKQGNQQQRQRQQQPPLFCEVHYPTVRSLLNHHQDHHQHQQNKVFSADREAVEALPSLHEFSNGQQTLSRPPNSVNETEKGGANHRFNTQSTVTTSISNTFESGQSGETNQCLTESACDMQISSVSKITEESDGSTRPCTKFDGEIKASSSLNDIAGKEGEVSSNHPLTTSAIDTQMMPLPSNTQSKESDELVHDGFQATSISNHGNDKEPDQAVPFVNKCADDVLKMALSKNAKDKEVDEATPFLLDIVSVEEKTSILNRKAEIESKEQDTNPNILNSTRITAAIESLSQYCYSTTKATVGGASLTGSVVGGVAGLAVAGPAGAFIGSKLGQAACVLTVLYQGRKVILIGAGLLAAGMTISSASARALEQQNDDKNYHLLTLDEDTMEVNNKGKRSTSSSGTLVLLRPNVIIDHTLWDEVISNVKESYSMALIKKTNSSGADSDIFEATELDTEEKVLLLVSRSLNDKTSLPGYMFRYLMEEHRKRVEKRRNVSLASNRTEDNMNTGSNNIKISDATDPVSALYTRESRQDAHAIILYVTTAFLEVRPEVRSCQRFMDLAKDSVEIVVLSELYQSIFEEIIAEVSSKDISLTAKIGQFELSPSHNLLCVKCSSDAIEALQSIAKYHSPIQKLEIFVTFLELISVMYSTCTGNSDGSSSSIINADSLLTCVCRHIILAKVDNLNAEVGFVEEFSKDEHLLRGKSGYALVTMQASLHVLNECSSFDCFFQEQF